MKELKGRVVGDLGGTRLALLEELLSHSKMKNAEDHEVWEISSGSEDEL